MTLFPLRPFGEHPSDLDLDLSPGTTPLPGIRILHTCYSPQYRTGDHHGGTGLDGKPDVSHPGDNGRGHIETQGRDHGIEQRRDHGIPRLEDPEDFLWDMPVGDRIAHLLVLAFGENPSMTRILTCPEEGCGEAMDVPLHLDSLPGVREVLEMKEMRERDGGDRIITVNLDGGAVRLRRPTGSDQRRWMDRGNIPGDDPVHDMIASLLVEDPGHPREAPFSPGEVRIMEDALEEADPLVNLTLTVTCPGCGGLSNHPLDLEAMALSRLRERQKQLIHEVHTIASRYHWTEEEILALPPRRRATYLDLIEGFGP